MPNDPVAGQPAGGPAASPPSTGANTLLSEPAPQGGPIGQEAPVGLPVAGVPPEPAIAGTLNVGNGEKWFNGYRNPQVRDFLKERGFASAEETIESFYTLNERVGDGGDYVRLPRDGRMSLDERQAVYRRLGTPETPDGYDLQVPKERASDQHFQDLRETARGIFAEHDVPQDLAQALFASLVQTDVAYAEKLATELREGNERDVERLKSEYGQDFTALINRGKRAVQTLGLDTETLTDLEGSLSLPATMKLLAAIGSRLGEGQAQFGGFFGEQAQEVPVASLTPEQAQLEIDRHLQDDAFMGLVYDDTQPGHARAWQRFFDLHRVAPWT